MWDDAEGHDEAERYGVTLDAIHSSTGGGGSHYVFRPPPGVVLLNKVKNIGDWPFEHCDTRGEGGYIVAPGSWHASGRQYTWSAPFDVTTLPDVPAALLNVWRTPASDPRSAETEWDESEGQPGDESALDGDDGQGTATALYYLNRYLHQVKEEEADRNPTGFFLALQLRDAPLRYDEALPYMRRFQVAVETLRWEKKPYDWKEAEASLKQAYQDPNRRRRSAPPGGSASPHGKAPPFDWRAKDEQANALLEREIVMKDFVVNSFIPHGLTYVGGRPKTGKSTLVMQVGLGCAREKGLVLGQGVRHGTVLMILLEDTAARTKRRLQQMLGFDAQLNPLPGPARLHIHYEWPTYGEGGLTYLSEFVAEYPDTVAARIDSASLFRGPVPRGGGYDIDYSLSHDLSLWVNREDISLLITTHTGKRKIGDSPDDDPLDLIQNTSGITAGADTVLVMRRQDGIMTLYRRGRDLEDNDPVKLAGDESTLLWRPDESLGAQSAHDAILYMLALASTPLTPHQLAVATGIKDNAIRVALFRMLNDRKERKVGVLLGGRDPQYYLTERGPTNAPPTMGDSQ